MMIFFELLKKKDECMYLDLERLSTNLGVQRRLLFGCLN
jgi:hypothetical protein